METDTSSGGRTHMEADWKRIGWDAIPPVCGMRGALYAGVPIGSGITTNCVGTSQGPGGGEGRADK